MYSRSISIPVQTCKDGLGVNRYLPCSDAPLPASRHWARNVSSESGSVSKQTSSFSTGAVKAVPASSIGGWWAPPPMCRRGSRPSC